MPRTIDPGIAVIGIDIGKNSFHVVGLDRRGAIALRQKWSRGQVDARLAISLQERRARPESRLGVTICRSDSRQCTAADPPAAAGVLQCRARGRGARRSHSVGLAWRAGVPALTWIPHFE
jgi:hypothetical protein